MSLGPAAPSVTVAVSFLTTSPIDARRDDHS